jgi:hypothetical protein
MGFDSRSLYPKDEKGCPSENYLSKGGCSTNSELFDGVTIQTAIMAIRPLYSVPAIVTARAFNIRTLRALCPRRLKTTSSKSFTQHTILSSEHNNVAVDPNWQGLAK